MTAFQKFRARARARTLAPAFQGQFSNGVKRKQIKKDILAFNAVFLEEEDGGYSVGVPALPGCFSQGDSFEDAMKNIQEAIQLYLEDERENKEWLQYRVKREFMAPVQLYG